MTIRRRLATTLGVIVALAGGAHAWAPRAQAAPAPEVEYIYDVTVRRHYSFPAGADAVAYGYRICDQIGQGSSYPHIMGDVRTDVQPDDEFAANYLVANAVNLLCPAQIWRLRNSAASYVPPMG
jgi:hypothetical protein